MVGYYKALNLEDEKIFESKEFKERFKYKGIFKILKRLQELDIIENVEFKETFLNELPYIVEERKNVIQDMV